VPFIGGSGAHYRGVRWPSKGGQVHMIGGSVAHDKVVRPGLRGVGEARAEGHVAQV